MTHDEASELLGAYVLGALTEEEERAVSDHVATCPTCSEEVAGLLTVHEQLSLLAVERDPPPELRVRLMKLVEQDRAAWLQERSSAAAQEQQGPPAASGPGHWWDRLFGRLLVLPRPIYAAGGLLAVAIIAAGVVLATRGGATVHTYACAVVKPRVLGLDLRDTTCSLGVRGDGAIDVAFNELPILPRDRAYELWLINPKRGSPVPVGGFNAGADRRFVGRFHIDAVGYPLAGVTIERAPGTSQTPTLSTLGLEIRLQS